MLLKAFLGVKINFSIVQYELLKSKMFAENYIYFSVSTAPK